MKFKFRLYLTNIYHSVFPEKIIRNLKELNNDKPNTCISSFDCLNRTDDVLQMAVDYAEHYAHELGETFQVYSLRNRIYIRPKKEALPPEATWLQDVDPWIHQKQQKTKDSSKS